ncbi:MAG: hypothetical protein RL328_1694 [Acidobacteriota bacterium]|jgi:Na+-driven multidrug efflux pump
MALALLLFMFFIAIVMVTLFVFPPSKWLEWFYNNPDEKKDEQK